MSETPSLENVMVTGATGFVGRSVVRTLLAKGLRPICLVRSRDKLLSQHRDVDPDSLTTVIGNLNDAAALREAAELSQAAIHLVGIIIERRLSGQTFQGIHMRGTQAVVDAARQAGIKRFIHVSALGSRADALSKYHQTKWAAEEYVRTSGLDWTVLRPSLIHGPHGEFMQLMKRLICGWVPPFVPYFGDGQAKVQPVSVEDVARCCVESLYRSDSKGEIIPLGGPKVYSWLELYNAFRAGMPSARLWKPLVAQPVPIAKLIAILSAPALALAEVVFPPVRRFRFDRGQVQMSQEDNVCDHTIAERVYDMRMRLLEDELAIYCDLIL